MRRISLGGMYHRFRRASLKTRSFMTCFLKRLSRASCDSPSFKVTFVNTLTSFLRQDLTHLAIHMGRRKPGLFTHVPDDNRVCTALAVRRSHTAARTLVHRSQPLYRKGDAHLDAVTATPRALVQSTWRPFSSTEAAATSPAACLWPLIQAQMTVTLYQISGLRSKPAHAAAVGTAETPCQRAARNSAIQSPTSCSRPCKK